MSTLKEFHVTSDPAKNSPLTQRLRTLATQALQNIVLGFRTLDTMLVDESILHGASHENGSNPNLFPTSQLELPNYGNWYVKDEKVQEDVQATLYDGPCFLT